MSVRVSDYFSSEELIHSDTAARLGISNEPTFEVACTAILAAKYMDVVRRILGSPVLINSWIRTLVLNRALKSADSSQHLKGEAIDFRCPDAGSPMQIATKLALTKTDVPFDQLILEYSWVHISFAITPGRKPRGDVLTLTKSGAYVPGLVTLP